ncbi:ComEC/Rec2 family competence protein [Nocardioides yefusunii]|uniref:ComEC/Rec2 family competence protein n=1 Tax=Nocardioides yefusunii TaxID=2500546 RepID=A0ABW1QXY7_9ACTN|nr:ComEC/Rec2 family competence protein [Nocardioides yefusunii]
MTSRREITVVDLAPDVPAGVPREVHDLRLPVAASGLWVGALAGLAGGGWAFATVGGAVVLTVVARLYRRPTCHVGVQVLVVAVTLVLGVLLGLGRATVADHRVVAELAHAGRPVTLHGQVASDPRSVASGVGDQVSVRMNVETVETTSAVFAVDDQVLLLASSWPADAVLGARVSLTASPLPDQRGQRTAWRVRGAPEVTEQPDVWWRGAAAVRASLRAVVAERPEDQRALVPSLVVGDDAGVGEELAADFRTTGLTHLLAVSGTNLTLLLGLALWVAQRCGVRGRWRWLVGAACIAGFVLVARSEPSVVRAATMGTVALFALERHATGRGLRCLALAVLAVLVVDPWMARSVGLALSVLATAGILLLTPGWATAAERWMPRWVALALAVPLAAQVACTPVVVALQGEVSLVGVFANIAAAPAVAPATILGLVAGLVGLVSVTVGSRIALPASWAVGWIAVVAHRGADLTMPGVPWGSGALALGLLTLLVVLSLPVVPWVLARPMVCVPVTLLLVVVILRGVPTPGWPPRGWVMVACDVGQGDALVLRAGDGAAVVVDAGPEPRAVERCLDRLGVEEVPLAVLTHFHADHVDGLEGVLAGRRVGKVETTPVREPGDRSAEVEAVAARAGVAVVPAVAGTVSEVGEVRIERIWPVCTLGEPCPDAVDNDSSVVLLATVAGVEILLTGDVEPPAQRHLRRILSGRQVDVLKVPHHGSRHQDDAFLEAVAPRVAVVSSGADNTYGHPNPDLVAGLEARGAQVLRTDEGGDVALTVRDGRLGQVSRR